MNLWLTEDELTLRTGYKQNPRRCRELARQGVKFTTRFDGFPLVDCAQFGENLTRPLKKRQPDFSALQKAG